MKKIIALVSSGLLSVNLYAQYSSLNVSMYALWDSIAIPAEPFWLRYNGCWGWADTTNNREYGIIGSTEGVHFVDITNPSVPVQRDFVAGRRNQTIWREMKTYQNYLYVVSDDAAPNSMQIIDLSYLPDSVHVVYDSDTLVQRAHTIWIDSDKMYLATPQNSSGISLMGVYSLASPENPTLIRTLEQDYPLPSFVHDMFVRGDTLYVSDGFSGLYIFKFTGTNFVNLGSPLTAYPQQGYNHSSSLTGNGKTLIFCDEVPSGLAVKSLDVSDFSNLTVLDTFKSSSSSAATPHNPFVIGNNRVVIAYYMDGIQIFDISNPSNVVRTGYFDTTPTDSSGGYGGCWGAYPYFPSGIMIASDMQKGMFILNPGIALSVSSQPVENSSVVNVMPNPVKNILSISLLLKKNESVSFDVFDLSGRRIHTENKSVSSGNTNEKISMESLCTGIYILKITGETFSSAHKIVKTN